MTDFNNKDNKEKVITATDQTAKTSPDDKTNNQTAQPNSELANNIGNVVRGDVEAAKDVYKQAKESTGKIAGRAYDTATKKATSKIDEQKTNLAQGLSSVADNIRQMGDNLHGAEETHGIAQVTADYSHSVANQVEKFSGYLENKDLGELVNDVEDFAHRNPALFLGGAFALGILAARFLKSGNPNQALMRRPRNRRGLDYLPEGRKNTFQPERKNEREKANFNQSDANLNTAGTNDKTSASAASSNKGV